MIFDPLKNDRVLSCKDDLGGVFFEKLQRSNPGIVFFLSEHLAEGGLQFNPVHHRIVENITRIDYSPRAPR